MELKVPNLLLIKSNCNKQVAFARVITINCVASEFTKFFIKSYRMILSVGSGTTTTTVSISTLYDHYMTYL